TAIMTMDFSLASNAAFYFLKNNVIIVREKQKSELKRTVQPEYSQCTKA
ncbi:hypothetical protein I9026_13100, partial [Staphylococcus felis]|nr:hypothetical protein [Staphylococcus felis]